MASCLQARLSKGHVQASRTEQRGSRLKLGALNHKPSKSEDSGPRAPRETRTSRGRPGLQRRHPHQQPVAEPRDEASPQEGLPWGPLRSPRCSS